MNLDISSYIPYITMTVAIFSAYIAYLRLEKSERPKIIRLIIVISVSVFFIVGGYKLLPSVTSLSAASFIHQNPKKEHTHIEELIQDLSRQECDLKVYNNLVSLFDENAKMSKIVDKVSIQNHHKTILMNFCLNEREINFKILNIEFINEKVYKIDYE